MRPLNFEQFFEPHEKACKIAEKWEIWDGARTPWKEAVKELRRYIYATDTRQTTNSKLPWKNSTTVPKLGAIRETLLAQYMKALFPHNNWFAWQPRDLASSSADKSKAVTSFMKVMLDQGKFLSSANQLLLDWLDTGNVFSEPQFKRETKDDGTVVFEGVVARRIDPFDIVFDPTVDRFSDSPTITRSIKTVGDILIELEEDPGLNYDQEVLNKLVGKRREMRSWPQDRLNRFDHLPVSGFGDPSIYANSDLVELLEFRGHWYDVDTGKLSKNQIITVVDRTYILREVSDDSNSLGRIQHSAYRPRPNNLWGMSPLENLVGMQYRLDHVENMKADILDQYNHPRVVIKGQVDDFEDVPGERIYTDADSEVSWQRPDIATLQNENEMRVYMSLMEEIAGAPKDLAGVRTPGNKTLEEVTQLQTNSQALFLNKAMMFEMNFWEPLINSMFDMAVRRMSRHMELAVPNDDFGIAEFITLTPEDLSGNGLIRPMGARRFLTKSQLLRNLVDFSNTPIGNDPAVNVHMSGKRMAEMIEELLEVEQFGLVRPNVRVFEQAETQQLAETAAQQVQANVDTPTELSEDDIEAQLDEIEPEGGEIGTTGIDQ